MRVVPCANMMRREDLQEHVKSIVHNARFMFGGNIEKALSTIQSGGVCTWSALVEHLPYLKRWVSKPMPEFCSSLYKFSWCSSTPDQNMSNNTSQSLTQLQKLRVEIYNSDLFWGLASKSSWYSSVAPCGSAQVSTRFLSTSFLRLCPLVRGQWGKKDRTSYGNNHFHQHEGLSPMLFNQFIPIVFDMFVNIVMNFLSLSVIVICFFPWLV